MAARDRGEALALWRYHLIAEALDPKLTGRERGQLVRRIAGEHEGPGGELRSVSRNTADRWIRRYRAQGLAGLRDQPRSDVGTARLDPALLDEAIRLRLEAPARSAAHISDIIRTRHGVRIAEHMAGDPPRLRPAGLAPPEPDLDREQVLGPEPQLDRPAHEPWVDLVLVALEADRGGPADAPVEAISSIWQGVCRAGLTAMAAGPIASSELYARVIAPLITPVTLTPFGSPVAVDAASDTRQFAAEVLDAASTHSLEAARAWAVGDGSAIAGLGLLLVLEGRLRALGTPPPGWNEVAMQGGERQPGLAQLTTWLAEHLKSNPTVHDTMAWLVRAIVLWPHEAIAYSKLPELTFRFRWESGRLRFFDLRPERFGLTDIRRDPLGRLAADIGLLDWTPDGGVPTDIGRTFTADVLA